MPSPTNCGNCNAKLNDSELWHHKQTCEKYRIELSESVCLCRGCEQERDRVHQIALEADEDQPYYEW